MRKYDVVYILKKDAPAEELRYSLRSIEENLPYRKVVFVCGKPNGFEPDLHIKHRQVGYLKWERARSSMLAICKDERLTKNVWLFNDDFFVLQPMTSEKPLTSGTIRKHYQAIEARHGNRSTEYSRQLKQLEATLKRAGLPTNDFALHVPMLINREKMLKALEAFPRCPMFRSLYGNYAGIKGEQGKDNKVIKNGEVDWSRQFLSTTEKTFPSIKDHLEELFPTPSKYETK